MRASAAVREVSTIGGRASGVVLDNGERLVASDGVIGALHPHILPDMVDGIPPATAARAKRTHITDAACFTVHAALDAPLRFKARNADGSDLSAVMYELMPAQLRGHAPRLRRTALRQFQPHAAGGGRPADPARSEPLRPRARRFSMPGTMCPMPARTGASWDEAKGEFAAGMIARMGNYIENLPDMVLDYHCDSPVDMERTSPSFYRGDLHGIATTPYQSGAHRPTPELGGYRVPGVERLYLVGPFQHPGGGVFGAGRATAMVMAEDIGVAFDQIRVN